MLTIDFSNVAINMKVCTYVPAFFYPEKLLDFLRGLSCIYWHDPIIPFFELYLLLSLDSIFVHYLRYPREQISDIDIF